MGLSSYGSADVELNSVCGVGVRILVISVYLVLFLCSLAGTRADPRPTNISLNCTKRVYELSDFGDGVHSSPSPDHSSQIVWARDFSFRVLKAGLEIAGFKISDLSSNIEILWAPNSTMFAVNYSTGGAEGTFHAHVYRLEAGKLTELDKPVNTAFDEFKRQFYCAARGDNVFVEGWTADSQGLLVVGQVYATSDCGDNRGLEKGYLMDLNGNVLRRYDDKTTRVIQSSCEKSNRASLP
jgi:hypothetical protein